MNKHGINIGECLSFLVTFQPPADAVVGKEMLHPTNVCLNKQQAILSLTFLAK